MRPLLDNALVDEVRLVIFASVVGSGGRLFGELTDSKAVRLSNVERIGEAFVRLSYQMLPAQQ